MKTWRLGANVTVSAYTDVEAETLEEAIDIAESRGVEIGGPTSGVDSFESWVVEEADGSAEGIHLDGD